MHTAIIAIRANWADINSWAGTCLLHYAIPERYVRRRGQ